MASSEADNCLLPKAACSFVLKNLDEIAKCDAFFNISFELLAGLLSEDALFTKSEYTLFNNVLSWIDYDEEERRPFAAALMTKIRFSLLSKNELSKASARASSLQILDEELSRFLEEAREYKEDEYRQALLQSPQTRVRSNGYQLVVHHGTRLQWLNFENGANTNMVIDHCLTYRPCICVVDNFMYTCGGSDGETNGPATGRCSRFDPRFDRWLGLTAMNESRKDFVTVAIDRRLYAIGGRKSRKSRNANAVALNSVEQFDINTKCWIMRSGLADTVYCHAGALYDGRIYISGGKKSGGCSKEFMSYDPETDAWENKPPMSSARCNHVMVAVKGTLYVIGGNVEDADGSPVPVTSIEMFDPLTQVWSLCRTKLSIYGASSAVMDDNIYIVGGSMGLKAVRYRIESGDIQQINETSIYPGSVTASCILQMPQRFPSD